VLAKVQLPIQLLNRLSRSWAVYKMLHWIHLPDIYIEEAHAYIFVWQ
jgi:hypothetical protein